MKLKGLIILTVGILTVTNAIAGSVIVANPDSIGDSTAYVMPMSLPTEFNQQVSMDRSFTNMEQFAARLQSLSGFRVIVNNQNTQPTVVPVKIYQINGTLSSLLDQAALKFNARWKYDQQNAQILLMYNQGISKTVLAAKKEAAIQQTLPPDEQTREWAMNPDDIELRSALTRWCKAAGWQLDWQVQGKFPIDFSYKTTGTFKQAVNRVLKSTQQSDLPLSATMFKDNKVLRISITGN